MSLFFIVQEMLYNVYFSYSYPSEFMNLKRFKSFIVKIFKVQENFHNFDINTVYKNFFYAFDVSLKSCLSFQDFLLGNLISLINTFLIN